MTLRVTLVLLDLAFLAVMRSVFGQEHPREVTTTEYLSFAGRAIHINDSYGDLKIEGWDRPEVEITVLRSAPYGHKPKPEIDSEASGSRSGRRGTHIQHRSNDMDHPGTSPWCQR